MAPGHGAKIGISARFKVIGTNWRRTNASFSSSGTFAVCLAIMAHHKDSITVEWPSNKFLFAVGQKRTRQIFAVC